MRVLLCAADRNLLRHLARFLSVVGFDVELAADVRLAEAASSACRPDFVMIDDATAVRGGLELCRKLTSDVGASPVVAFMLAKNLTTDDVTAALEAGVDDFLTLPVVYGEVLARLRAGARLNQYEQRERAQAPLDPLTLLPNRGALVEQLRWTLAEESSDTIGCVLLRIDYFARIATVHGRRAADALLQAFAVELNKLCPTTAMAASFGEATFGVLLPKHNDADAAKWAENARKTLGEFPYKVADAAVQLSTSVGVGVAEPGADADDLVRRVTAALTAAERSGHNCVVRDGQHDDSAADAKLTHLFDRTTAGDVATPITLLLRHDESLATAQALLSANSLGHLPVVDKHGKLLGVVVADPKAAGRNATGCTVREAMQTDIPEVDHAASFDDLMNQFGDDTCNLVAVLQGGKPLGFVTRDSLVALSQPIKSDTFISRGNFSSRSEYLVVGDVVGVAE